MNTKVQGRSRMIYPIGNYDLAYSITQVKIYSIVPLSVSINKNRKAVILYKVGCLGEPVQEKNIQRKSTVEC